MTVVSTQHCQLACYYWEISVALSRAFLCDYLANSFSNTSTRPCSRLHAVRLVSGRPTFTLNKLIGGASSHFLLY